MKHRMLLTGAMALFSLAWFGGCSSSEETAKDTNSGGEFTATDKQEIVIPATDQPSNTGSEVARTEAARSEKPAPAVVTAEPSGGGQVATLQEPPAVSTDAQKTGMLMWAVQIGAFKNEAGAVALINEARTKFQVPVYKDYDAVSGFYKVTVGSFPTREQAAQFKEEVLSKGYTGAFTSEVRR